MASSEEERLIQMVKDFIESGSNRPNSPSPLEPIPAHPNPIFSTLQDVLKRVTNTESEILEKILIYLRDMEFAGETNINPREWVVLRLRKDGFEASLCRTSWLSTFGRPSGEYEYIDVMIEEDKSNGVEPVRLIVDMEFRSQFEVARPTSTYSELSSCLPCIFVGTEEKLMKIVSVLCSAAKQSLRERKLHIPPWRKASYMQSKWLSENCKKISFSPTE